jgi:glycosyltransferase involved in cell wall biosynthesis
MKPYDQLESRRLLGLPEEGFILGAVRDSRRSHEILGQTLRILMDRVPSARLLLIGRDPAGMAEVMGECEVSGRVVLPGWVQDDALPRYLASCDVLVLPLEDNLANRGRWPHKLGDMIASGRPVVTSHVGDFPTLLHQRDAAVVVGCTPEEFSAEVESLWSNRDRAAELGARGRAVAVEELTWDVVGRQVAQVVSKVA